MWWVISHDVMCNIVNIRCNIFNPQREPQIPFVIAIVLANLIFCIFIATDVFEELFVAHIERWSIFEHFISEQLKRVLHFGGTIVTSHRYIAVNILFVSNFVDSYKKNYAKMVSIFIFVIFSTFFIASLSRKRIW